VEGFLHHIRRLRELLRGLGSSREDSEDLIQEAFLRLHIYCQTHEVRQQEAFLVRTVQNLSVDRHRRAHRDLYVDEPVETLHLVDLGVSPDEDAALRQRLDRVRSVLDSLKPRTREVFLMHRLDGYSSAQIAKHFEISVSAVEKHIARAVLALMAVAEGET